jgi:hypothetical protein
MVKKVKRKLVLKRLVHPAKPGGNGAKGGHRRGRAVRVRLIGESKGLEGD